MTIADRIRADSSIQLLNQIKEGTLADALFNLAEKGGLFGFRVTSAKTSSLISFGTACGILRKQCLLVEPKGFLEVPRHLSK